jgi:predicted phosphodiesterase
MILMFGDVHGSFKHVLPIVRRENPAAIIFLGDLQAQKPLEQELAKVLALTEVYFIHGNHDTGSQLDYDNLFNSKLADRNLHGRVVEIDGHRVAGLGGVFRGKIWWPDPVENNSVHASYEDLERSLTTELAYHKISPAKAHGELRTHRSSIFYADWVNLFGQPADILVTHEAPSCHPHGFKVIDSLAQSMKAKFTFHGHHHDRLNYNSHEKRLGFSAHGVGYRGVSDMYGGMLLAGSQDEERMYRGEQ